MHAERGVDTARQALPAGVVMGRCPQADPRSLAYSRPLSGSRIRPLRLGAPMAGAILAYECAGAASVVSWAEFAGSKISVPTNPSLAIWKSPVV